MEPVYIKLLLGMHSHFQTMFSGFSVMFVRNFHNTSSFITVADMYRVMTTNKQLLQYLERLSEASLRLSRCVMTIPLNRDISLGNFKYLTAITAVQDMRRLRKNLDDKHRLNIKTFGKRLHNLAYTQVNIIHLNADSEVSML
jgi:hypothetical protein